MVVAVPSWFRRRVLPVILILVSGSGCASSSPLRVDLIDAAAFDPRETEMVFLSQTRWDPEIRRTLALRGITVKRFSATRSVERDLTPFERERFRAAEARYGLTVYLGRILDFCMVTENVKYGNITYEITDLRRNLVIATVQQGGGTGPCAWHRDNVFDDLAEALAQFWTGK
jgi:hypothetical protein